MIMKPLTEFCTLNMGQSPDSKTYNDHRNGLPFYQGNADFGEIHPETRVWCSAPVKIAEADDILISVRAPIGAMNIAAERCCIGRGLAALTPIGEKCGKQFLYYALQSKVDSLIAQGTGSTFKAISKKVLETTQIPAYSIHEQEQITATIGHVDHAIAARRRQIVLIDQLVKSRFVELFGNGHDGKTPVKMLGSICKFQQGTQIPVEEQFEEQIAGYKRFLRIIDYTQAPQPPRYVNVNGKEVDEKSVVIVRYGATAGFVGRGYQGILANNLFEIIPDETILSKEFLFLALKYGTFEKEVHDKAFGAAMPALSFSMMNDIPVVVPMSEQQSQFVSFVEQTDKSKLAIQESLAELETLKKALMQKYFG